MGKTLQLRKLADKAGDPPKKGEPWPLAGIELIGEAPQAHHFGAEFLGRAALEGWLSLTEGKIVLHLTDGDLAYRIVRPPGRYTADGVPPTPEQFAAGDFSVDNFFACELEDA
jgi:hypothetical protein